MKQKLPGVKTRKVFTTLYRYFTLQRMLWFHNKSCGETASVFFGGGGEFVNCGLHPATPNFQFTHTFYYRVDFVEEYNSPLSFKKAACKNRR